MSYKTFPIQTADEKRKNVLPKALLRCIQEEGDDLAVLAEQHVISAKQYSKKSLIQLFRLAAKYESNPRRYSTALQGKILISAFYEPSTRTRLSFESAWHRLGGDIMSITDRATTGIAKGECLDDIAEMFNHYGDCVVLRDNRESSVYSMLSALKIPIINAGNGCDEHPTQAMADIYTIFKWKPELVSLLHANSIPKTEPIVLGVVGVPSKMRTVRSLLKLVETFSVCFKKVVIVCDNTQTGAVFSKGQKEHLTQLGITVELTSDLESVLPTFDVTYINTIAWEEEKVQTYGRSYQLNQASPLKSDGIILHPLARGAELDKSLDSSSHNWYFTQAKGAVYLRMALLTCLAERTERVIDAIY